MVTALKDNQDLKFAVITGCLRIAKESVFTGTKNFASYSVLDEDFCEYFGFTASEAFALLAAADRADKAEVIKEWYDGYLFGNSYVYCPWDVINYTSALRKRKDAKPKNYWKNTSHNGILLGFVNRTDFKVKSKFETLLNDGMSKHESKLETDCENAISQMNTRKYADGLYGYEQILCYGIAFFQKQAKIKVHHD